MKTTKSVDLIDLQMLIDKAGNISYAIFISFNIR